MERVLTRIFQGYWRLSRGLTMGAQALVMNDAGQVLLIRHTYRSGWHFPGGGVEKNETLQCAVTRELAEEAGIIVKGGAVDIASKDNRTLNDALQLIGIFAHFDAFPSDHIALFRVLHWEQPVVPPPNREIAEQGFFAADALPDGTSLGTRARIIEAVNGSPPALHW